MLDDDEALLPELDCVVAALAFGFGVGVYLGLAGGQYGGLAGTGGAFVEVQAGRVRAATASIV